MKAKAKKSGGGLVLVMVILIMMSILSLGLFGLVKYDSIETVYMDHSEEAFWSAEEGLSRIVQQVGWDELYRNSPYAISTLTNKFGYVAVVVDKTTSGVSEIFTLRSTGYALRAERAVELKLRVSPGIPAFDFGDGGDLGTGNTIDAPIIIRPGGEIDTGNNAGSVINDYIIGDADGISGSGVYEGQVNLPDDYQPPTLNDASYQAVILGAGPADGSPPTYTTNADNTITIAYHTDPASAVADLPIPDGATLIAPGTIDFGNNHAVVGNDVKIYAGEHIQFPGHSSVGSGSILFADQNIEFSTHGSSTDSGFTGVVLLSENGDISFSSQSYFDGLIFAEKGTVHIGASADIDGAVIAQNGIKKKDTGNAPVSGLTASFRPDLFDLTLIGGLDINWNGQVVIKMVPGSWREL